MLACPVADADALRPALTQQPLHDSPQRLAPLRTHRGAVDQEQIHVPRPALLPGINLLQAPQTAPVVPLRVPRAVVDLGRDEHLAPRHARVPQPRADLGLVAVHLRRVHVPVPEAQRRAHGGGRHVVGRGPDAEAEDRDARGGVGEREGAGQAEGGGDGEGCGEWVRRVVGFGGRRALCGGLLVGGEGNVTWVEMPEGFDQRVDWGSEAGGALTTSS